MSDSSSLNNAKKEHRVDQPTPSSVTSRSKGNWHDEIDALFSERKTKKRQQQAEAAEKQRRVLSKKQKRVADKSRPGKNGADDWVDDGLGGVYNQEGYTGRMEDGVRVFKAHVLRKTNSGQTPDCPFDCDCCFI
jgi:hypothetical protein